MTDHTEMQIPDDVARAAIKAYDAPLNDDGASLVGIVNRMAEDYVKLAIARAILAERERCARIAEEAKPRQVWAGQQGMIWLAPDGLSISREIRSVDK